MFLQNFAENHRKVPGSAEFCRIFAEIGFSHFKLVSPCGALLEEFFQGGSALSFPVTLTLWDTLGK